MWYFISSCTYVLRLSCSHCCFWCFLLNICAINKNFALLADILGQSSISKVYMASNCTYAVEASRAIVWLMIKLQSFRWEEKQCCSHMYLKPQIFFSFEMQGRYAVWEIYSHSRLAVWGVHKNLRCTYLPEEENNHTQMQMHTLSLDGKKKNSQGGIEVFCNMTVFSPSSL